MRKQLSIGTIISTVLNGAVRQAVQQPSLEAVPESGGTTIRFDPELRAFLDAQAKGLGVPLTSVVTMILRGVMETSKAEVRGGDLGQEATLMVDRFHMLLTAHEVDVPTAVELLSEYGITTQALCDREMLGEILAKRAAIDFLADVFGVDVKWLLGRSDYPGHHVGEWYKNLTQFCGRVSTLAEKRQRPEIIFVRSTTSDLASAKNLGDKFSEQDITPLVRRTVTLPSGATISTVEQWPTERWNYENCRLHLKAMMLWASKHGPSLGVRYIGLRIVDEAHDALASRRILPVDALNTMKIGAAWYPEDYVEKHPQQLESDELEYVERLLGEYESRWQRHNENMVGRSSGAAT